MAAFSGVGVVCTVIDLAGYALFVAMAAAPALANVLGFLAANLSGYFLNGWITFRRDGARARFSPGAYGKYLSAYLVGLAFSTVFIWAFADAIGVFPAKLCTIALTAVLNYLVSAFFIFGDSPAASSDAPTDPAP
ncbi:MAG: GtrA family protein [Pseudomonadota bacterium]